MHSLNRLCCGAVMQVHYLGYIKPGHELHKAQCWKPVHIVLIQLVLQFLLSLGDMYFHVISSFTSATTASCQRDIVTSYPKALICSYFSLNSASLDQLIEVRIGLGIE